jgi:hypothetical protein
MDVDGIGVSEVCGVFVVVISLLPVREKWTYIGKRVIFGHSVTPELPLEGEKRSNF